MMLCSDEIVRGVRSILERAGPTAARTQELASYLGSALLCGWVTLWMLIRDRNRMGTESVWHAPDLDAAQVKEATLKWQPGAGEGMVGRAWRSGLSLASVDIVADMALPRSIMMKNTGFRTGLWIPLQGRHGISGVLATTRRPGHPRARPARGRLFARRSRSHDAARKPALVGLDRP